MFYIESLRFSTGSKTDGSDYTPEWDDCGPQNLLWDTSDDGFWRTHVRTHEQVSTYSADFVFTASEAYTAGVADGLEWAVGKTQPQIEAEVALQQGVISVFSDRDPFDFGRATALQVEGGVSLPFFGGASSLAPFRGGHSWGWFTAILDAFLNPSPADRMYLFVESDTFARNFNRSYIAGWAGGHAAQFDALAANPENTSKVYDQSRLISQFDTLDYDLYVDAYDLAYTFVWGVFNP